MAADMGGLRPCTIRGGVESLGEAEGDEAKGTLGGVEICGRVDSTSTDESGGGPCADVGEPEKAAGTRSGVEALVGDTDAAAVNEDTESRDDTD